MNPKNILNLPAFRPVEPDCPIDKEAGHQYLQRPCGPTHVGHHLPADPEAAIQRRLQNHYALRAYKGRLQFRPLLTSITAAAQTTKRFRAKMPQEHAAGDIPQHPKGYQEDPARHQPVKRAPDLDRFDLFQQFPV